MELRGFRVLGLGLDDSGFRAYTVNPKPTRKAVVHGQFAEIGSLLGVLFFKGAVPYWAPEKGP